MALSLVLCRTPCYVPMQQGRPQHCHLDANEQALGEVDNEREEWTLGLEGRLAVE